MSLRSSNVYIVVSGEHVKIGVAYELKRRLKDIGNACPIKPTLHASREFADNDTAHQVEQRMHQFFHKHRLNGEWFAIDPAAASDLLRTIEPLPTLPRSKRYNDMRQTPESMETMRDALNAAARD